ncbi:MAG: alkaline phosphatase family protein [Acidimicrobiales bacterium]
MNAGIQPVLPRFNGACLSNLLPAIVASLDRPGDEPEWLPAPVRDATQVVVLVLDGLGYEQLASRRSIAPTISSGTGGPVTTVAPSTTACALTSLVTGLPPAVHGMVGYRVHVDGDVFNILKWRIGPRDARETIRAREFQRYVSFPRTARATPEIRTPGGSGGERADLVPVVTRNDYRPTGFTAAHLAEAKLYGWQTAAEIPVEVSALLNDGHQLVYAYYDGIDRVSHARGLDQHFDAELRFADRLVADMLSELPKGSVLVVTADHGQVDVGPSVEVLGPDVMDGVTLLTGEGRFRWLHTLPGAEEDVASAARETYGNIAWVWTRDELVEEGILGGEPVPEVMARLGDVVLAPFSDTAFFDPADVGEQRLVGRHGSLTAAEMLVPLLAWSAPGT